MTSEGEYSTKTLNHMIVSSFLLPPPGGDIVRKLATAMRERNSRIMELERQLKALRLQCGQEETS